MRSSEMFLGLWLLSYTKEYTTKILDVGREFAENGMFFLFFLFTRIPDPSLSSLSKVILLLNMI
jgi:hypothetical protein